VRWCISLMRPPPAIEDGAWAVQSRNRFASTRNVHSSPLRRIRRGRARSSPRALPLLVSCVLPHGRQESRIQQNLLNRRLTIPTGGVVWQCWVWLRTIRLGCLGRTLTCGALAKQDDPMNHESRAEGTRWIQGGTRSQMLDRSSRLVCVMEAPSAVIWMR